MASTRTAILGTVSDPLGPKKLTHIAYCNGRTANPCTSQTSATSPLPLPCSVGLIRVLLYLVYLLDKN
jgi:hypothetical protein